QSPAARIINISSISGIEPGFYNPHYTVTKAATINLSKYLANQLTPDGVLVNVVCPGPVYSDSWDRNVQRIADMRDIPLHEARELVNKEEELKIPLGRIGTGNDVAALATFLASDQADWITGSCFHVNGGKLRSMC
ncbi:MAG: SDR family oxidoreductase, partial [Armatimonadota bacterium]